MFHSEDGAPRSSEISEQTCYHTLCNNPEDSNLNRQITGKLSTLCLFSGCKDVCFVYWFHETVYHI